MEDVKKSNTAPVKNFILNLNTKISFIKIQRSIVPFDHQTKSFGRLRPVSSLLGFISQPQPKNFNPSIYKRLIMPNFKLKASL